MSTNNLKKFNIETSIKSIRKKCPPIADNLQPLHTNGISAFVSIILPKGNSQNMYECIVELCQNSNICRRYSKCFKKFWFKPNNLSSMLKFSKKQNKCVIMYFNVFGIRWWREYRVIYIYRRKGKWIPSDFRAASL